MSGVTVNVPDLAGTEAFGRQLGALLFPGAVIALIGQLGAGKTHLTRALAEGLNVRNPMAVTSPTFVLIHEYTARLPIYHFDAYRLGSDREFLDLGADEYFHGDGVSVVEWADRVPGAMPHERLEIRIDVLNETARRFTLRAFGERYQRLLTAVNAEPTS
ncbi:tRNA (adenosine(37)-N6)-threonylcarbamoyltransferase complex ATPase subunit type 1 TsaE [Limnoglobus roseus]|uniref:tRNA threonylcarbamoyladenosine biosynthesis protein TsaE n=1 Tax=Limnoglobus roseus TaxID=2598579 RepID=A0A5C1A640_9BACT|nr:tRNA (adenosine(37)-N6)-threonylcarbamoyltransferase complex ATPase subunit type 1 TsaE [Limnoglobus roseus]QEL14679.1 tRNA (adenosine(37)-N6)-threonylcarbamoyltransferase complex ATPase subunit type 1 TsaE [Limnoglobus roseus]